LSAQLERLRRHEEIISTLEPWVGPEGQLRVRLERLELAVLAHISDPGNAFSAAEKARAILTAIPTPQA